MTGNQGDYRWPFWPIVPLYPYGRRRTIRHEVVKDTIWTFDQLQGIFYVVVPVRMTVIRLESGGLAVYSPVAPTGECIRWMRELENTYGTVRYIILPTISGIEHKVFVGPFSRFFPEATVYIAPEQWSFPVNLPPGWLGLPGKRTEVLPVDSATTVIGKDFDYEILPAIDLNLGDFSEVAFFHRASRTLLLTDTIVSIPDEPPAILQLEPYPLLFHSRDSALEPILDTPENRRRGWQRICLFALYFQPSVLEVPPFGAVLAEAFKTSYRSKEAYFGLYPFRWRDNWRDSFNILRGEGRPLVAPILRTLILNRTPERVGDWARKVARWDIETIVPCHFDSPIEANSRDFLSAFDFLRKDKESLPEGDLACLRGIDRFLTRSRLVPPAREMISKYLP